MNNSLKILIRNLYRNSLYTWINITGLAISLAAVIFIMLWVQDEWSYDKSHKHVDNIYVVFDHTIDNGNEEYNEYLPVPLARAIQTELAEVEAATVLGNEWYLGYLDYEGTKYFLDHYTDFALADSSFFNVFDFEFIEGSPQYAFRDANSIIITDELASVLFGNESALGKVLKGNSGGPYYVSAVIKKSPENSIFQFKAILSFEQTPRMQRWTQWTSRAFVRLNPQSDPQVIAEKISQVHKKYNKNYKIDFPTVLQPLSRYHLYAADGSETGIKNVRLFTIIAITLLTIACINYVNLVTARSKKRIKEIALRKIVGANRVRLFLQMMGETVLLLVASIILATVLLYLFTPYYSVLTGKSLSFNVFNSNVLFLYLVSFLFIIVHAGIYPAVFLSSFNPLGVFKQKTPERRGGLSFRKILIIFQFVCSVAFILATITIKNQQRYMQTKGLGYDRENIFTMDILSNKEAMEQYNAFKQVLEQQTEIAGITASEQNILDGGNFSDYRWDGAPDGYNFSAATMGVDRNFFDMLNLKVKEGRGYSGTTADSLCLFVNETLVRQMGVDDPLNTTIYLGGKWHVGKKTGVIEDFHFRHMNELIGPIVMYLSDDYWTIYVKAVAGKTREALATTDRVWKEFFPEYPLMYKFMDETFDTMYKNDIRTGYLFNAFAVVAIFISCLGLFGLATYTAETRTKEIGIRKTLGASMANIVGMLSKEFVVLVGIACAIGIPVAYYLMNKMLQSYAYRISITWWMILTAILAVLILTILTVSAQALKAARANPVKSIKTE